MPFWAKHDGECPWAKEDVHQQQGSCDRHEHSSSANKESPSPVEVASNCPGELGKVNLRHCSAEQGDRQRQHALGQAKPTCDLSAAPVRNHKDGQLQAKYIKESRWSRHKRETPIARN